MALATQIAALGAYLIVTVGAAWLVAWLTTRWTLRRCMMRLEAQREQRAAQSDTEQSIHCGMCGQPVGSVSEGIDHVSDVHKLRLDRENAPAILNGVDSE